MKNIFVVGSEPFNLALMRAMPGAEAYAFHDLLTYAEAVQWRDGGINVEALLRLAERRLDAFRGSIDAIIGYWDFPSSAIVPVLRHRHGLPAPSLEAVAACEHKYWSRLEQKHTVPDLVPRFAAVDPFADDPLASIDIPFPFWLKPVKAHSSFLGFKIRNTADFDHALPIIRANIAHFGDAFNAFLGMLEVPDPVSGIGGNHCIAEEIISGGRQCTLEGYVWQGTPVIYGIVDSIRSGRHRSCFSRYQYPSALPRRVQARMSDAAGRFMRHIGYAHRPFNMEFFWSPDADAVRLLEVNARLSKSHSPLFQMVDGVTHQQVEIDLCLGNKPAPPYRQGKHDIAAKFMLRVFEDSVVRRTPGAVDEARLHERFPGAMLRIMVEEGQRLAHLGYQDSYSFELAELFMGAANQRELLEKYRAACAILPFELDTGKPAAA